MRVLLDWLRAWGREPRRATEAPNGRQELYLYLPVGDARVLVGTLAREGREFVFGYSDEFRSRSDLPAISSFPDKSKIYRSETLWPFFDVRVPPVDRPDVQEVVREKNLDTSDVLSLLAELGRKTVATPYEFERRRLEPRHA